MLEDKKPSNNTVNLEKLLKEAQKIQNNMKAAQNELAKSEVIGSTESKEVQITMNGKHEVTKVDIDSSIAGANKKALQDLIVIAINDAVRKIEKIAQEKMR